LRAPAIFSKNGYSTKEELMCPAATKPPSQLFTEHFVHTSEYNHSAESPFTPGTRISRRKGAFELVFYIILLSVRVFYVLSVLI
jgi:hypothetical protein